jgi:ABC-2 type transport system ATP-binding protein
MPTIEVEGLVKRYGDLEAVAGVDLTIEEGEVFALLGPNGAGKTTTVEILEGHRQRTAGEVRVLGFDPGKAERALKERIGIVLQETSVEAELKVIEALDIYGGTYPKRRDPMELLEIVGLTEKAGARIGTLSGGQRRRLELALGLVGDPDVLFLDEPTTGFDPSARRQAWTAIQNLRSLGKTILLTTHYMDEAQNLSDRVAVITKGKIVAEGTPNTIGGRDVTQSRIAFRVAAGEGLPLPVTSENGFLVATTDHVTADLHRLTSWALERRIELQDLTVTRPSLEDIYLALTEEG